MEWKLFADLAELAGTKRVRIEIETDATVEDALDALLARHPALKPRVLSESGNLHDHINLLHNGTNVVTEAEGLDTPVEASDELALFPPVSGG